MVRFKEADAEILIRRTQANRDAIKKPPPKKRPGVNKGRTLQVDSDTFPGKATKCPDCGITWQTADRRGTRRIGNVDFDMYSCKCKGPDGKYRQWERYK